MNKYPGLDAFIFSYWPSRPIPNVSNNSNDFTHYIRDVNETVGYIK